MRLLDTYTGKFCERNPNQWGFNYAILSHTWDADGEQTHKELKKIQMRYINECLFPAEMGPRGLVQPLSVIWQDRDLSPKIRDACRIAREDGYRYIWIDSCCIDKTSSSELSEAINSMYAWYQSATVCYAYLADVPLEEVPYKDGSSLRRSKWFTGGWTLQELLAPKNLIFLSKNWMGLGSKEEFAKLVNDITGITVHALFHPQSLSTFSVAQRLSWASNRETTRVEDRAYSLLGIFDINMPTLYGEGGRAFQRLQEEILRRIPDQSIFAFSDPETNPWIVCVDNLDPGLRFTRLLPNDSHKFEYCQLYSNSWLSHSLLSSSPNNFLSAQRVPLAQLSYYYPELPPTEYSFTPHGIRMHIPLIPLSAFKSDLPLRYQGGQSEWYLAILGCEHEDYPGRLLARVCHLLPSAPGINFLICAFIFCAIETQGEVGGEPLPSTNDHRNWFFALSVEALVQLSPLARVLPVYVSNLEPLNSTIKDPFEEDMRHHPHKMIYLMLKKKAGAPGADSSPSSNVDEHETTLSLRRPDQDNPNTHWLTISRPASQGTVDVQDTITVEYKHTLEDDGMRLTIVAIVRGTLRGHPIIHVTSTWNSQPSWRYWDPQYQGGKRVLVLDNKNGGIAKLELNLEYLAPNHYLADAHTTWIYDERHDLEPEDAGGNMGAPMLPQDHAPRMSEDHTPREALQDGAPGTLEDNTSAGAYASEDGAIAAQDGGAKRSLWILKRARHIWSCIWIKRAGARRVPESGLASTQQG